jgi:hypothetical protein
MPSSIHLSHQYFREQVDRWCAAACIILTKFVSCWTSATRSRKNSLILVYCSSHSHPYYICLSIICTDILEYYDARSQKVFMMRLDSWPRFFIISVIILYNHLNFIIQTSVRSIFKIQVKDSKNINRINYRLRFVSETVKKLPTQFLPQGRCVPLSFIRPSNSIWTFYIRRRLDIRNNHTHRQ